MAEEEIRRMNVECSNAECTKQAVKEVFWPGKTVVMCIDHALGAANVAQAMGFPLDIRDLPKEQKSK